MICSVVYLTGYLEVVKKVVEEEEGMVLQNLQLVMDHQRNLQPVMGLLRVKNLDTVDQGPNQGLLHHNQDHHVHPQDRDLQHHLVDQQHLDHKVQDPKLLFNKVMVVRSKLKQVMEGPNKQFQDMVDRNKLTLEEGNRYNL